MDRRSVTLDDLILFQELDLLYNQIRVLQAEHNTLETRCIGSGRCCKIGLQIPMFECASIAFNINLEYYAKLEDRGRQEADEWFEMVKGNLKEAMRDETWNETGATEKWCAFYSNGCSIYRFRPMVCRQYGVTTPVDDFCPRKRYEDGTIDVFGGESVERVVKGYQDLVDRYNTLSDATNYVVYMPLGVLYFLLDEEEMNDLANNSVEKLWGGRKIYSVYFTQKHGYSDRIPDGDKDAKWTDGRKKSSKKRLTGSKRSAKIPSTDDK